MFRHALHGKHVQVASAGLAAVVGRSMDTNAQSLLSKSGLDGSDHRARQLDARMLHGAELVLVMERVHLHHLARVAPQASGKAFLLGKWQGDREIPDPHRQPPHVFEDVHRMMCEGVQGWLSHL
ncbi:low molecular weight phosphotyrosine protein phosphatase [Stenotrophomonas sp. SY1]|uniref:arsenate reductase/protein-tyrosine-phosphatase family protein n=1 Tax=Stenotrophomonas sp. SY1 TaxID=477235 RepID=UPI001E3CEA13|nr:low molecular weight phosphotyrosine protein phosphatase [Stenotrophomonas sp. SY1]MCD9086644.1 low molecular weight phosphotyrosine protein phosphatase [Stenotrophomonas sp. SY1]